MCRRYFEIAKQKSQQKTERAFLDMTPVGILKITLCITNGLRRAPEFRTNRRNESDDIITVEAVFIRVFIGDRVSRELQRVPETEKVYIIILVPISITVTSLWNGETGDTIMEE